MAHPNETVFLPAFKLEPGHVLIGEAGGRSVVREASPSSSIPGLWAIETEHGFLYLDPDPEIEYEVEIEGSLL